MWKIAIVLLLVSACGSKTPSAGTGAGTGTGTAAGGAEGAVCECGERTDAPCTPVTCRADLVCGYGCGIPGCDSTCMTQEQFEHSKTIP